MSLPLALTVKHEGRSIQLTITSCKVYMASEFAGNVDLYLDCDPSLEPIVQESLHLQVPGEDTGVELIASGGPDDGVMLVFHCEAIERLERAPECLTFLWCGEPLATVSPELADSVPIDDVHSLIDPLEILGQPTIPTSNPFCLGSQRGWLPLLPALLLFGLGLGMWFGPSGAEASLWPYLRLGGAGLLLAAVGMVLLTFLLPKRQVWLDVERREVLVVSARTLSVKRSLVDATRRSTDEFAHVRLCKRDYAAALGSDSDASRTEYRVSLEGPIAFGAKDGRVHSRSDALHLATFSGLGASRRFAAEVGFHLGLRILIASDW